MTFADSVRTWPIRRLIGAADQIFINIRLISLFRLQLKFQLPPLDDVSETNRKELIQSIDSFYDWRLSSEICARSNPESYYFHWLCNDDESKSLRELTFRVSHWSATSEADRTDIEQTFRDVFQCDMNPLTVAEILKLRRKIQKRKKSMHRQWNDSRGNKINLRLKDFAIFIPLVSAALVCAGYLHTSIVYKHFGIDPTRFFSVGDYLASSLEQIRLVLFSLLGFIAGVVYGYRRESIKTKYEREREEHKHQVLDYFWYTLSACSLLAAYFAWDKVAILPGQEILLLVCLLIVIESPLARLVNRYCNNSQSVYLVSIALIIFFGSMYMGANTRIAHIESEQTKQAYQIISQQKSYTHHNSKLIGANSKYMFIWDRKNRVEVIPLSQIDRAIFWGNQITAKSKFPADIDGP